MPATPPPPPPAPPAPPVSASVGSNAATAAKTILVVDDSPTTRKFLRLSLACEAWKILEAADGLAALDTLAGHTPNLFLVDLNMPRMDGLTLVRRLRAKPEFQVTPIVVLTTRNTADDRKAGYAAGVTVYLTKPIEPDMLLFKVQALL